jgi:hypothetical protein
VTAKDILNEYIGNDSNEPYDGNKPYKELLQVKSPLRENVKTKKKAATSDSGDDESESEDDESENKGDKNNNKVEFTPILDTKKRKLLPFARLDNDNATPLVSKKPKI